MGGRAGRLELDGRRWEAGKGKSCGAGQSVNRDDVRVATSLDLTVDRESGAIKVGRVVVAHDCGLVINPGLKNQVEGNVVQSLSRTLHEEVTFDTARVTSCDWVGYPILQFSEIPDSIDAVHTAPASPRPARPPQPSAMRCSTPRGPLAPDAVPA